MSTHGEPGACRPSGEVPVLIVGGGPIGLALAADLGRRGVAALLVDEQSHRITSEDVGAAKMIVVSMRTGEFCRSLGLSEQVRNWGFPLDHGLDSVFVTSMSGWELGRVRTPSLAAEPHSAHSPERDRPCPQNWFDPILRDHVERAGVVEMRSGTSLTSFVQERDCVVASLLDIATGERSTVRASYLVGCDGYNSTVRRLLGIAVRGERHLDLSMSVYLRMPELERHHSIGSAYRYAAVSEQGVWAVLTTIDGRDLYRFQLVGATNEDVRSVDVDEAVRRFLGFEVPYEVIETSIWERKMTVADRFLDGRVCIAGDAAHAHPPNGGLGMNTGILDAWDLGWKLAALLDGWGGDELLGAYDIERRPACHRAAEQSLRNFHRLMTEEPQPLICEASERGEEVRARIGRQLQEENARSWNQSGTHLGYLYFPSPLIVDDGSPIPEDDTYGYTPTARPGARAPHVWLSDGRSILDLFGLWFTLLSFGDLDCGAFVRAAAERGVPLEVRVVDDAQAAEAYERKLVLVRPDGHVAWRGDSVPAQPGEIIDAARGAGPGIAARRADGVGSPIHQRTRKERT